MTPVFAVADPDDIGIGDVYVFDNVLETNDILVYVRCDVNYGTEPGEDAEDTFQMAIYDTDGTTLMDGCVRALNYYQHNIISIYLDADDNVLTVGEAYRVRIMGNPGLFDLEENVNMDTWTLSTGDYRDVGLFAGIVVAQA